MAKKIVNLLVALALVASLIVVLPATVGAAAPPPVANAGPDQLIMPYTTGPVGSLVYDPVTLSAAASYDLTGGEVLQFKWTCTTSPSGSAPTFNPNSEAETVTFAPIHGVYVFQLAVTAGGDTSTDTVTVVCGGAIWYVAMNGNDGNSGTGPGAGFAWRHITAAVAKPQVVHGDIIIVGPSGSNRYGGPADPENIVVNKSIKLLSSNGRLATVVDVSGQGTIPLAVITVTPPALPLQGVVLPGPEIGGCPNQGFTLQGAVAMGVNATGYDFVEINCNKIVVEELRGIGIGVLGCKYPIIDGNEIKVGDSQAMYSAGIYVQGCLGAQVINNKILVMASTDVVSMAVGIEVMQSPKSLIQRNEVNIDIQEDAFATGILVFTCDWVQVLDNTVDIIMWSDYIGEAEGIAVWQSMYATILNNTIDVWASVRMNPGWTWVEGIDVYECDFSKVDLNKITTYAYGNLGVTLALPAEVEEALADFGPDAQQLVVIRTQRIQVLLAEARAVTGCNSITDLGGPGAVGIFAQYSDKLVIGICPLAANSSGFGNIIDVDIEAEGTADATFTGLLQQALGEGVVASNCTGVWVECNDVSCDVSGSASVRTSGFPDSIAFTGALASSVGIKLIDCPPYHNFHDGMAESISLPIQVIHSKVNGNHVVVTSDLEVEALAASLEEPLNAQGLVPTVGSILKVVEDVVNQSIESEYVGVDPMGSPLPLDAYAMSIGVSAAIGILAIDSPGVIITDNVPVDATASLLMLSVALSGVIVQPMEGDPPPTNPTCPDAGAYGGGAAVAAGIATIESMGASGEFAEFEGADIGFNNVSAKATANGIVLAAEVPVVLDTVAIGGTAAIAVGILVGCVDHAITHENLVTADGQALVMVGSEENIANENSFGLGGAIGAGIGIAHVNSDDSLIISNTVDAHGDATVGVGAETVTVSDPWAAALGGAAGIGVAIVAIGCEDDGMSTFEQEEAGDQFFSWDDDDYGVVITNNQIEGVVGGTAGQEGGATGTATVDIYANEDWIFVNAYEIASQDVLAHAGALGIGIGILVAMCEHPYIASDQGETQPVTARGYADVNSVATSSVPLAKVWNAALGIGVGIGIAVFCSCDAEVGPCNILDGAGEAGVCTEIAGDPLQVDVAVGLGLDLLFFGLECCDKGCPNKGSLECSTPESEEDPVDQGRRCYSGKANYNSFVGIGGSSAEVIGAPPEFSVEYALVIDLGMLAIDCGRVDGRYNYWGNESGPSCFGPGYGQGIAWLKVCRGIKYEPWSWIEHTYCIENHQLKAGISIPLTKCWNTFSVPFSLSDKVNTWGELIDFSRARSSLTIAYQWVNAPGGDFGQWVMVTDTTEVKPLVGLYIKMNAPAVMLLLASQQEIMPTQQFATGWNLTGPCPPPLDNGELVELFVAPIEGPPGQGYAFVYSPGVGVRQDTWVWAGQPSLALGSQAWGLIPCMLNGLAYWVFMDSDDIAAGKGNTPIRDLYPSSNWCPYPVEYRY